MTINFETIEPREVIQADKLNDIFNLTGSLFTDENMRHGALQRRHFEEAKTFNDPINTVSTGSSTVVTSSTGWETVQQINQLNVFRDRPEVFRCNFQAEVSGSTITGTSNVQKASQFALFRVYLDGVGQIGPIFTLGATGITNGNGGTNNSITIHYEKLLMRQYYFHPGTSTITSNFFRLEGRVAATGIVPPAAMTIELSNRYGFSVRHKE